MKEEGGRNGKGGEERRGREGWDTRGGGGKRKEGEWEKDGRREERGLHVRKRMEGDLRRREEKGVLEETEEEKISWKVDVENRKKMMGRKKEK